MSGEIGVPEQGPEQGAEQGQDTILWRTLKECRTKGWITATEISPGLYSIALTEPGRRRIAAASA
jgi:hypothetical protein